MKIGILVFTTRASKTNFAAARLRDESRKRGHTATILHKDRFVMTIDNTGLHLTYNRKPLKTFDVIISRVGISQDLIIQASIIEHLQLMGIPVINRYYPVLQAKNKLHSLQILSAAGIPVVKSAMCFSQDFLDESLRQIQSFPIIVKTPYGSFGRGVSVFETRRSAKSAYQMISGKMSLLMQEYIKESKGKDIRALVVGNKVVAAMERKAQKGDFRSNIHAGGKGKKIDLNENLQNLAIKATKILNLDFAGVDIIITKNGPAIIEVNCNPGVSIEEISNINVSEELVMYAEEFVNQFIPPVENLYL